jgi:anti-sigma regulatory factor (Ser/Thr protein kinase)
MRYFVKIATWLIVLLGASSLSANVLTLDGKFYIHKGFSAEWIERVPGTGEGWLVRDTHKAGSYQIRILDVPLPGKTEKKSLFTLEEIPPLTCTIITSFTVPDRSVIEGRALGLWIPQIAENWQVYLNGTLIRSEVFLNRDGTIGKFRNMRDVLVFLNPLHMNVGVNVLAFRIIGDPTIQDTGFYQNNPLRIDSYEKLERARTKIIPLILIFIYLLVGMYHLVLFLIRRTERYNLIFALFSSMLFIYLLSRTGNIYSIISDTKFTYLIEFCSLYTLFPLLIYFMDIILFKRVRLFVHAYGTYCLALIVATMVLPYSTRIEILRLWQYTSPVAVIYFLFFQVGSAFVRQVRGYGLWNKGGDKQGLWHAIGYSIVRTTAGNLLVGSLVGAGCAVFDIVNSIYFNIPIVLTNYGFLLFVMGITMMLSNRFVILYQKIDGLNVSLRERTADLKETRVKYDFSQEKYRLLVEGTKDAIFSLDENLRFITANRALQEILGADMESLATKTLYDVLYDPDERSVTAQFVQEKIGNFLKDSKPITLKIDFNTSLGIEPVSMQVRLEIIRIEGRNEIFGRGTSVAEDVLINYLQTERQKYHIGNLLLVADDLSYRITRNLQKYIDKREINLIRIAVREIIINAIEHGNLAITFEEKSQEMIGDGYLRYLNERQKDPRFRDRIVTIDYHVDRDRVVYTITDEGKGFDYRKFLDGDIDVNTAMLAHGRGITLAKNIFDEIRFNETGNEVSLVKMLKELD